MKGCVGAVLSSLLVVFNKGKTTQTVRSNNIEVIPKRPYTFFNQSYSPPSFGLCEAQNFCVAELFSFATDDFLVRKRCSTTMNAIVFQLCMI